MTHEARDAPQFYLTAPAPCPYLPDRKERKVFTHVIGRRAVALNDMLSQIGFRRSQTIAYRPACDACQSCVSVRVDVDGFAPSRRLARILERNRDLARHAQPNCATAEHYALFRAYLDARHQDGGMADMTMSDFSMMVEDSHVATQLVEYRRAGTLLGACLTDTLSDGLSMVYSFYACDDARRSLGAFMILDHIALARSLGFARLYLGYWVEGSRKMAYKAEFLPQERLRGGVWQREG